MRPPPRLFIDHDISNPCDLETHHAHYLQHVLRLGSGDPVLIFNGRDGEWLATLQAAGKKNLRLIPQQQQRPQPQPSSPLLLAFAPLRRQNTELLLQKATELGVTHLQPTITARTQAHGLKADRLRDILIEAAEQSERLDIPTLLPSLSLAEFLAAHPPNQPLLFAAERGAALPPLQAMAGLGGAISLLIGPEGGFTNTEYATISALAFVRPIALGSLILKAETAALALLSCWQANGGAWRDAARTDSSG